MWIVERGVQNSIEESCGNGRAQGPLNNCELATEASAAVANLEKTELVKMETKYNPKFS
jgi:hypothetical protein